MARSKAERGYQLTAQRPATAVKASAKAFVENLTPKATTAGTLRRVVAHGLAVLTANIETLLRYDDPEYVHQARVALRRVRSAIRLLIASTVTCRNHSPTSCNGLRAPWRSATGTCSPTKRCRRSEGIGVQAMKPLVVQANRGAARRDRKSEGGAIAALCGSR